MVFPRFQETISSSAESLGPGEAEVIELVLGLGLIDDDNFLSAFFNFYFVVLASPFQRSLKACRLVL
jgi:hypothetical protein